MKSLVQILLLSAFVLLIAYFSYAPDIVVIEAPKNVKNIVQQEDEFIKDDTADEKEADLIEEDVVEQSIKLNEQQEKTISAMEKEVSVVAETPVVQKSEVKPKPVEETPQIPFSTINEEVRKAVVNILCTTKNGGSFNSISGSGVVIDKKGIVLTNAHVAQYFLLKDYLVEDFIQCVLRTGSPAKSQYLATPIFISPSWIKENASNIIEQTHLGTGENDYALLFITGRTDQSAVLPDTFSFIPPLYDTESVAVGEEVLLAAYPAGFLGGITIAKDLYITSTITKIMDVFTFKDNTIDLFSIGGSVVAQQGSSGGAVVDGFSKLIGIIVTSSVAEITSDRDLRAITIGHINRSLLKDAGFNLKTLLESDISAKVQEFNKNTSPVLTQLLIAELEK